MRSKKKDSESERKHVRPPAISSEARQNQMIALAVNLAEQQLMDGTASSQIITHYLKLATAKEQLELEKTKAEVELMKAKAEAIKSAERMEDLYTNAIEAMKSYGGFTGGGSDENIF